MSVFKPFITSDVIVSPFKVNKTFTFNNTSELTGSGVDIFMGENLNPSLWISGSNPTGNITTQDKYLIYRSIRDLYYSNFIYGVDGSPANTASFNPDNTITGPQYEPSYYNYLTNTLPANRYFPTGSNDIIGILSIPSNLFGEYIKPGSFHIALSGSIILDPSSNEYVDDDYIDDYFQTASSSSIVINDDNQGNLLIDDIKVGDIIYEHGMVILTNNISSSLVNDFVQSDNLVCSFDSTITIYESQYKCTIKENEFNFTQNPSLISGSSNSGVIVDFATGSYFNPYVTSIGLYNNNKELIAVAKLSQPLPLSSVTDTTIMVNLDL